jgi:hypothetical protein
VGAPSAIARSEVLRHLPNLRGITDAGVAKLAFCEKTKNIA